MSATQLVLVFCVLPLKAVTTLPVACLVSSPPNSTQWLEIHDSFALVSNRMLVSRPCIVPFTSILSLLLGMDLSLVTGGSYKTCIGWLRGAEFSNTFSLVAYFLSMCMPFKLVRHDPKPPGAIKHKDTPGSLALRAL